MVKKKLKMIGIVVGSLIIVVILIGIIFINTSPEFGENPSKNDLIKFKKSINYKAGKFKNSTKTSMSMSFKETIVTLKDYIKGVPNSEPTNDILVEKVDSTNWQKNDSTNRIVWFGHSSFLLKLDGKNILIDPMLGNTPAPHPWLGGKRYSSELPIEIEKLPRIDAVLISHDHYDHLDYGSIQKLKNKTNQFLVPFGIGAHLKSWGIKETRITEFDWWDELTFEHIKFAFTPSRHFSGRGLTNRFSTLWGSWVIKGVKENLYFSGDSGFGKHFKDIGEKYGPFDFAMMECGQYNEKWADIHMMPEQTVQASIDIKSNMTMPIHWAAFTLSIHSWKEPVERFSNKAKEENLNFIIPKIGEEIKLINSETNFKDWWLKN